MLGFTYYFCLTYQTTGTQKKASGHSRGQVSKRHPQKGRLPTREPLEALNLKALKWADRPYSLEMNFTLLWGLGNVI